MSCIVGAKLVAEVRARARDICEYCKIPYGYNGTEFEIDHIVPRGLKGSDSLQNLAWSCLRCNTNKGPHIAAIDPLTGKRIMLFDPRADDWHRHFRMIDGTIKARTAKARTTLDRLDMNDYESVLVRGILYKTERVP